MDEKEQVCVEVDNSKGAGPHILMSVDKDYWVGLVTAINSILRAAQSPHLVKFHIVVSGVEKERLLSYLRCYDILLPDQVEVAEMNPDWVRGNIKVHMDSAVVGNLASLGNFARFYFHRLFPDLTRGIYLDSDIIVKGDIFQFWDTLLDSNKILIAAKRTTPTYQSVFSKEAEAIFEQR
jgi:lipopolysaccharide biosynthesis glycosyltransferase